MPSYPNQIHAFLISITNSQNVVDFFLGLLKKRGTHMEFEDCVVYLKDENRRVLVQVAAGKSKQCVTNSGTKHRITERRITKAQ